MDYALDYLFKINFCFRLRRAKIDTQKKYNKMEIYGNSEGGRV